MSSHRIGGTTKSNPWWRVSISQRAISIQASCRAFCFRKQCPCPACLASGKQDRRGPGVQHSPHHGKDCTIEIVRLTVEHPDLSMLVGWQKCLVMMAASSLPAPKIPTVLGWYQLNVGPTSCCCGCGRFAAAGRGGKLCCAEPKEDISLRDVCLLSRRCGELRR